MRISRIVPVLRIFSVAKAREFYIEFLGFDLDWEHRFGADFPVYMQVARGSLVLHLSEHHGDASPGAALLIEIEGLDDWHRALAAKNYRYAKPGIEEMPWGAREMALIDPFGNRLRFSEPAAEDPPKP
jgi:catechol 2,3-dioxygenase-like lactoylglutathione lyase family enzyme